MLSKLYLWYAKLQRHRRRFVTERKIDVLEQLLPDLVERDRNFLGQMAESEGWAAFRRYLEIERRAARDNGLIQATDLLELGDVRGDINRCNKIEVDMQNFLEEYQERMKQKQLAPDVPVEETDEDISTDL